MSQARKHTASQDWVFGRETTAKELSVGESVNAARDGLTREVALRRRLRVDIARDSKSRDGGGESGQDWDERENPHGVSLRREELGSWRENWGASSEGLKGKYKKDRRR
jgi:hypothetical protein